MTMETPEVQQLAEKMGYDVWPEKEVGKFNMYKKDTNVLILHNVSIGFILYYLRRKEQYS